MNIHKVSGCCSMFVISNNPKLDFFSKRSDFLYNLRVSVLEHNNDRNNQGNKIECRKIKTVILITNEKKRLRMPWWLKKAYSYQGNNQSMAHVYHLELPKGL